MLSYTVVFRLWRRANVYLDTNFYGEHVAFVFDTEQVYDHVHRSPPLGFTRIRCMLCTHPLSLLLEHRCQYYNPSLPLVTNHLTLPTQNFECTLNHQYCYIPAIPHHQLITLTILGKCKHCKASHYTVPSCILLFLPACIQIFSSALTHLRSSFKRVCQTLSFVMSVRPSVITEKLGYD